MIEGRDMGDSEILQKTTQQSEGGKVRLKTTLPSGRDLTSEWMAPDAMKKVMIPWCDNVRQQVDADNREAEAKRKRDKDLEEDMEHKEDAVETETTNPVEYAVHQRDMYIARVEVLEERQEATEAELKRMREHLEQWNVIVHKLRGETDE